ncbi:hypothetical protein AUC71_02400 [Methyloceanibacter marginalis]|uniref:CSD domain-containing protein n=1 Tax=Methyloceanibacter marginalis TaxID=1774971 RepID=A0A1E3W8D1_9HYPH|nr:cold shock domain-containing protein [Methyloceanibacter marginalis]ODS02078.1 hypothetical protein AUC71_02400 [Methyloceanibacter marginalis]
MKTGTVKHWNRQRGFGFIRTDQGEEFFAHATCLMLARDFLDVGEAVIFETEPSERGGERAINVELAG